MYNMQHHDEIPVLVPQGSDKQNGNLVTIEQQATDSSPWLAAIPTVLSILATVGSWFVNRSSQREQNAFQESLIDKQNAYNSPNAQLNRLLAAGVPYNTAMASLSGTVGNQTQPMAGQAAPYTSVSAPSLGEFSQLTQLKDAHDIAQSQVRLNDAQSSNLSHQSDLIDQQISDMVERLDMFRSEHAETVALLQQRWTTEYYQGLNLALSAWSQGLYPIDIGTLDSILAEGGASLTTINNARKFENEFLHNIKKGQNVIESMSKQYSLESMDEEYMRTIFKDLILHDQEQLRHDIASWQSNSAALQYLGEHKSLQVIEYFLKSLSGYALNGSMAYGAIVGARRKPASRTINIFNGD